MYGIYILAVVLHTRPTIHTHKIYMAYVVFSNKKSFNLVCACPTSRSLFLSPWDYPRIPNKNQGKIIYVSLSVMIIINSVMRVRSDTFGNPIFQKGLQNQPSSRFISVQALPACQKFDLILVIKFFFN